MSPGLLLGREAPNRGGQALGDVHHAPSRMPVPGALYGGRPPAWVLASGIHPATAAAAAAPTARAALSALSAYAMSTLWAARGWVLSLSQPPETLRPAAAVQLMLQAGSEGGNNDNDIRSRGASLRALRNRRQEKVLQHTQ